MTGNGALVLVSCIPKVMAAGALKAPGLVSRSALRLQAERGQLANGFRPSRRVVLPLDPTIDLGELFVGQTDKNAGLAASG